MSIATEMAVEYFRLAAFAAERGETGEALRYSERATELLLRPSVEPGDNDSVSTQITAH